MTAKARWSTRLTVTTLAAATLAALTVAAPAHADRAQDCETLMNKAQREFYLYEWYGIALGYSSTDAKGHLKTSGEMADFWMVNC